eukprot:9209627-Pyramimonas_sp.AAC.2
MEDEDEAARLLLVEEAVRRVTGRGASFDDGFGEDEEALWVPEVGTQVQVRSALFETFGICVPKTLAECF